MPLTRRSFLKHLGASAAALPFISILERSVFGAEATGTAKRFIGLFHPHGVSSPLFLGPEGTTSVMDLHYADSVLSPFDDPATFGRSFKDVLLPVHGIDVFGAKGHDASVALLTGSNKQNASIDQFLAVDRGLGRDTPVTSVALAVGKEGGERLSFGAGGAELPKIIDPQQTFDLLFSTLIVGDDPEAAARAEQARLRGKSVLDFVRKDIGRLQPRLATPEKLKLDQHLTSLRDIEKRLDSGRGTGGPMCVKPAPPRKIDRIKKNNGGEPNFPEITDLQIDLLAMAMACDITRFGTLVLDDLSSGGAEVVGIDLQGDNHQDLAHRYSGPQKSHFSQPAIAGDRSTWVELGKLNRWHYSKCARLLQRLDEGGVLEETLVLMASDMGNPAGHSSWNIPVVLAGGAGGAFQMGRRVRLVDECPPNRRHCQEPDLVPNNHLLVSVAQAFGADIDSYGQHEDPDVTTGELSQL